MKENYNSLLDQQESSREKKSNEVQKSFPGASPIEHDRRAHLFKSNSFEILKQ